MKNVTQVAALFVGLVMVGCASQTKPADAEAGLPGDHDAFPDPDRKTRPGDLLRVNITDLVQPQQVTALDRRVDENGSISMHLLKKPISVRGLVPDDIGPRINSAYREGGYIQNAMVWIEVVETAEAASVRLGRIEAGDLLEIRCIDSPDLSEEICRRVIVRSSGEISMPLIPRIKLAGLSEGEAEVAINRELVLSGLHNPLIAVLRIAKDSPPRRLSASDRFLSREWPAIATADPDRKLRAGDLVRITVDRLYHPERRAAVDVRVGAAGAIWFPAVNTLAASDCTPSELGARVNMRVKELFDEKVFAWVELLEPVEHSAATPGPIEPGDVLELRIWDLIQPQTELRQVLRVHRDGTIYIPLMERFRVAGMTDQEAQKAIADAAWTFTRLQLTLTKMRSAAD